MFSNGKTTLLEDINTFLSSRICKDPESDKQIKRDWKFSLFSKHIKIYGENRCFANSDVIAEISIPSRDTVVIKPASTMTPEDREMLRSIIVHWTPSLQVIVK